MKVYIQSNAADIPYNVNAYAAWQGFTQMGIETIPFHIPSDIRTADKQDIIVGGVGRVKQHLEQLGIPVEDIDYPEELTPYLGRSIKKTTLRLIINDEAKWPVFIKPVDGKLFPGKKIQSLQDLIGIHHSIEDPPIWCSEIKEFQAEWRTFVRHGQILDIRRYKGTLDAHYNYQTITDAVNAYQTAPAAYAIDFGLSNTGETLLIEVNDGYSLGSYGLDPLHYAKLLSARWSQLTNTTDECSF